VDVDHRHVCRVYRLGLEDVFELLNWSPPEIEDARAHIDESITTVEAMIQRGKESMGEARAATKAVEK
jgi:hypothetical protein